MKKLIFLLLGFFPLCLAGQPGTEVLYPGGRLFNPGPDTLFCISKPKLETLMDREELNRELIAGLENRAAICDSLLVLKIRESENWRIQLLETDMLLENAEMLCAKQEHKHKIRKKIWFGAGVALGWLVCALL